MMPNQLDATRFLSSQFADLINFTAWSSMREPTQVFRLLEAIYAAFDDLGKHRGVFKVETAGKFHLAALSSSTSISHMYGSRCCYIMVIACR